MGILALGPDRRGLCFHLAIFLIYSSYMAVLLENYIFTFWCWILVIGRYAIMFRFGTRFLALTVDVK